MLQQKLANGDFVITAEIVPPLSGSADDLMVRVAPLAGLVDGVNMTDGAGARLAMSSLAASAILVREGFDPILQLTCRDRNRIGLAADLLGASALGIENLLILHGDDPSKGDMPEATGVFDLDSKGLLAMAGDMSGVVARDVANAPQFFIGCADAPIDPPVDWKPVGLQGKIDGGAQFAQTQFCFDLDVAKRYFARLEQEGISDKLKFIVGVGPLLSLKQARFMDENLYGVSVPNHIMARMEEAKDQKAEGRKICAELVDGLKQISGVCGVHVMAPMQSGKSIAEAIKAF